MRSPFRTPLFVVCAAAGLACGSVESLAPTPEVDESRALTSVSLGSVNPGLYPGETFPVLLVAKDQWGAPMVPDAITYSSSDPAVATVSDSGIVTAETVGTAVISATATVGAVSRTGAILVIVHVPHDPYTPTGVLLLFGGWGWDPPVVQVNAGALVEWSASGTSWSGVPTNFLWLMDANYSVIEQIDFTSGLAKREFNTPGTYRYCSGGCWDPPDFGVIHVN
jgi:hypothetical protein